MLDHLDRTRTGGGRDAFRRRILNPLHTAQEIQAVQHTLRFIATNRHQFDLLPAELQIAGVTRYLDSRFTTVVSVNGPALAFESWWIRVRHKDLFEEAIRGTRMIATFLARIHTMLRPLDGSPAPLADLVVAAHELLSRPAVASLRKAGGAFTSPANVLRRDHVARERERETLHKLVKLVFEIDALVSMSDATCEMGYTYPVIDEQYSGLEIQDLFHPFLERPVANDLRLAAPARLLFLTGPNMAGKTTYLKACGIAVVLAHSGMGIPASNARVGLVDRLLCAIRTEDSLRDGVSYFQAEARRVKVIGESLAQGWRCLVIVDELFRGTNVKDACDASLVVLQAFADARRSMFLVASHLIELADQLQPLPGVLLRRFEADLGSDPPAFDYRIKAGVSSQRLGMIVLKTEGVLDILAAIPAGSQGGTRTAHGA